MWLCVCPFDEAPEQVQGEAQMGDEDITVSPLLVGELGKELAPSLVSCPLPTPGSFLQGLHHRHQTGKRGKELSPVPGHAPTAAQQVLVFSVFSLKTRHFAHFTLNVQSAIITPGGVSVQSSG